MFREMKHARWRKRKAAPERRKDGLYAKNGQAEGAVGRVAARAHWLGKVLDVQARAGLDLINEAEEGRIREMWALDMWPQKWSAADVDADVPLDGIFSDGDRLIVQPLLVR